MKLQASWAILMVWSVAFGIVDRADAEREIWRQEINGDADYVYEDDASSLVLDSSGNVIAAGSLGNSDNQHGEFTVLKFAGSTGTELWREKVLSGDDSGGLARAVALDGDGNVIACGTMNHDLTVIKFDGDSGAELWRQQLDGSAGFPIFDTDDGYSVAVDGNGDVIAGGTLDDATAGNTFFVVKLNGATGAEVWRHELAGSEIEGPYSDRVRSIAVDSGGDAVAVGNLSSIDTGDDFIVIKLNGSTGAELWREVLSSMEGGRDEALAVALDKQADVIVAGTLAGVSPDFRDVFLVMKLGSISGDEIWRTEITSNFEFADVAAEAVSVDPDGDVVAVGLLEPAPSFFVAKLAAADGTELWSKAVDLGRGDALAVDLDGHGNVIAAGASLVEEEEDLAVIKLKGENGDEIWRHEIGGTGFCEIFCERARSVMVDATGNVIAAGQLTNGETAEDLVVVKLLPEPSPWILRLAALGAVALLVTQRSNRLRKKSHFGGSRRVTQICD